MNDNVYQFNPCLESFKEAIKEVSEIGDMQYFVIIAKSKSANDINICYYGQTEGLIYSMEVLKNELLNTDD